MALATNSNLLPSGWWRALIIDMMYGAKKGVYLTSWPAPKIYKPLSFLGLTFPPSCPDGSLEEIQWDWTRGFVEPKAFTTSYGFIPTRPREEDYEDNVSCQINSKNGSFPSSQPGMKAEEDDEVVSPPSTPPRNMQLQLFNHTPPFSTEPPPQKQSQRSTRKKKHHVHRTHSPSGAPSPPRASSPPHAYAPSPPPSPNRERRRASHSAATPGYHERRGYRTRSPTGTDFNGHSNGKPRTKARRPSAGPTSPSNGSSSGYADDARENVLGGGFTPTHGYDDNYGNHQPPSPTQRRRNTVHTQRPDGPSRRFSSNASTVSSSTYMSAAESCVGSDISGMSYGSGMYDDVHSPYMQRSSTMPRRRPPHDYGRPPPPPVWPEHPSQAPPPPPLQPSLFPSNPAMAPDMSAQYHHYASQPPPFRNVPPPPPPMRAPPPPMPHHAPPPPPPAGYGAPVSPSHPAFDPMNSSFVIDEVISTATTEDGKFYKVRWHNTWETKESIRHWKTTSKYRVEQTVEWRYDDNGGKIYKVRWKDTWEPEHEVQQEPAVQEFLKDRMGGETTEIWL